MLALQSTIKQKYQDKIIIKRENPCEKLLTQEQRSMNHGTQQTQDFSLNYL